MHRSCIVFSLLALAASAGTAAQGADANLARSVAAGCASCHGTNGTSLGAVPSIAGVAKADLVVKLQEFKSGKRTGTVMPQLAKGYTDEQIDLAAGWFAVQPVRTK